MSFYVIIPARYQSARLPGKPLRMLAGKTMLQHVYDVARMTNASSVVIATDDERIAKTAQQFGAQICMTSNEHSSGTQRISEVVQKYSIAHDAIVVNLQGDEPLMPAVCVNQVARLLLQHPDAQMATLSAPLHSDEEILNPNIVKVVTDKRGYALYFSRAPIPWQRDKNSEQRLHALQRGDYQRHIGIYAYRAGFIQEYIEYSPSPYELLESLEQLRVLWHGGRIIVAPAEQIPGPGVDTEEELERVQAILLKTS